MSAHVFDVTVESFQTQVLEGSSQTPVLLDFWAEWCGPCKTLGPVLEQLAEAYGGTFRLGKVDTEREQDLAYAFQIRSIPTCVLMVAGRPADAFTGALPERELKAFLKRHGIEPKGGEREEAAPADPNAPPMRLKRAREAVLRGEVDVARGLLEDFPEEDPTIGERDRLIEGLQFLARQIEVPPPAGDALLSAKAALVAGRIQQAMDDLLAAIGHDRAAAGPLARQGMLLSFSLLGEEGDLCEEYRSRLATLLY